MLQTAPPPRASILLTISCVRKNWARTLTWYSTSNCSRSHLQERLVERDSRVVDQAVDAAQKADGLPGQLDNFIQVVEVCLESRGPTSHGLDFFGGRLRPGRAVRVVKHHVGTLSGKFQRDLASNTGAGSGHQGTLPHQLRVCAHLTVSGKVNGLPCSSGRRLSPMSSTRAIPHGFGGEVAIRTTSVSVPVFSIPCSHQGGR